jgi:hypothetical protein
MDLRHLASVEGVDLKGLTKQVSLHHGQVSIAQIKECAPFRLNILEQQHSDLIEKRIVIKGTVTCDF